MRRAVVLAGLLIGLVALAGCGGGSDSGSTGGDSTSAQAGGEELTKSEWIAGADEVCGEFTSEREELQEEANALANEINEAGEGSEGAKEGTGQLADLLDEAADTGEAELGQIHALVPPAADEATIEAMLGPADRQIALTREGADALRAEEFSKFSELSDESSTAGDEARKTASAYGLEVCGTQGG